MFSAMAKRETGKASPPGRHLEGKASQDQLLCELEWQKTISESRLQSSKKTRQELEALRNSFAAVYQHSPIAYLTLNTRAHIKEANPAAGRLLGAEPSRLAHLPLSMFVLPDDVNRYLAHLTQCQQSSEKPVTTELRLRTRTGTMVPVQLVTVPFFAGGARLFQTAVVNLTDRCKNERALADSKAFAESIVQTIREPLAVLDSDFRVVSINRAFERYFSRSGNFVRGRMFEVLLNLWWSGNRLRAEFEKILVRDTPLENFELEIEPHGLGKRTVLLNASRLSANGTTAFILVALEDITARKVAETELRAVNQELERRVELRTADLQKSYEQMEAFCYSIAHDLRAPLRAMAGFTQIIAETSPNAEETRDYSDRIYKSAVRMDRLIQDLLTYGRLNTVGLPSQDVDVEKIWTDVLTENETEIAAKQAQIRKPQMLPPVKGHPIVLHVALGNLFTNALKFVRPGVPPRITVRAETRGSRVRLWIEDNGIGIPPDGLGKIFGVFQRLHNTEKYPGTGIGLALVSKGIERLGGRCGVESEIGKGSRFWIELSAVESPAPPPDPAHRNRKSEGVPPAKPVGLKPKLPGSDRRNRDEQMPAGRGRNRE
jgi:PAS domain S-box-containing protein